MYTQCWMDELQAHEPKSWGTDLFPPSYLSYQASADYHPTANTLASVYVLNACNAIYPVCVWQHPNVTVFVAPVL